MGRGQSLLFSDSFPCIVKSCPYRSREVTGSDVQGDANIQGSERDGDRNVGCVFVAIAGHAFGQYRCHGKPRSLHVCAAGGIQGDLIG